MLETIAGLVAFVVGASLASYAAEKLLERWGM